MLNSKQLLRISSLLRLFAWWLDLSTVSSQKEVDGLCELLEQEARIRAQDEMIEQPRWMNDAPWIWGDVNNE